MITALLANGRGMGFVLMALGLCAVGLPGLIGAALVVMIAEPGRRERAWLILSIGSAIGVWGAVWYIFTNGELPWAPELHGLGILAGLGLPGVVTGILALPFASWAGSFRCLR